MQSTEIPIYTEEQALEILRANTNVNCTPSDFAVEAFAQSDIVLQT